MLPLLVLVLTLMLPGSSAAHCAVPHNTSHDALFYVIPGRDIALTPLCESQSTSAIVLLSQCLETRGCTAFTVGSGGGEVGDLPPHDCRGSRLYTLADIDAATNHSGVDLYILGSQPAEEVVAVTPRPNKQQFPATPARVSINRLPPPLLPATRVTPPRSQGAVQHRERPR